MKNLKNTILLADNDLDFLNTRAEFLEQKGYRVFKAFTLEMAQHLLDNENIHLAILDIRLVDDDDEKDVSGLKLAKTPAYRAIPKIILTGFPSAKAVLEALGPAVDGLPPAVDFVAKEEGPEFLIDAVQNALSVQEVFIVHGRDDVAREAVAHFIEHVRLHPVILRDLPASGRTIVDQIDRYSNVEFVVVLLTPDDIVFSSTQPAQKQYRVSQNVIFELGFLIGQFGPSKVFVLYHDEVEILADYRGVLHVSMDQAGAWKWSLAQEMKLAGLSVDISRL